MKTVIAALTASLLVPAAAGAAEYPAPKDPGTLPPAHPGGEATLHVCKKPRCFQTIQKAVNASRSGDTIKIANGTYRESVIVRNNGRRGLRIIGNSKRAGKVVLDGKSLKGAKGQNGIFVFGVNNVTIKGLTVQNYRANGIFMQNVSGYLLTNLVAKNTGQYGLYAFNSKGGTMSNSIASGNGDSGYYVGQTPPQTKPKRTFLKNLRAHTNVLGYSGTNSRYVTIQNSKFWNNGAGIVPNSLDTEKFPPHEQNVIKNNEVFWNNFNYYLGAPFKSDGTQVGKLAYPIGVGILLFGGRDTTVENNTIYGNYLAGFAMIDQFLLENEEARPVENNTIIGNHFGLGGTDLNGRDIVYDGGGSDNCFADNGETQNNLPADNSELMPCPFSGSNGLNEEARQQVIAFAVESDHEKYWVKHPHAPKAGHTPLEHYEG